MKWIMHTKSKIETTTYGDCYPIKDTDDMMLISAYIKRRTIYFHLCLIYAKPFSY